jgi:hypothetical protein
MLRNTRVLVREIASDPVTSRTMLTAVAFVVVVAGLIRATIAIMFCVSGESTSLQECDAWAITA